MSKRIPRYCGPDETGTFLGWSWHPPEVRRELERKQAKRAARERAAAAKAERKLECARIKEMEKLDYEFTGFGWDGRMNFRPKASRAEPTEQLAAEVTPLDTWRARHAKG
jgi:hypothetical protein